MKRLLLLTAAIAGLLTSCGDSAIYTAQHFSPNNPPEIKDILFTTSDGQEVTSSYLVPGKVIRFSVTANDPDRDPLTFLFSSENGTFATQVVEGNTCRIDFVIGNISGGQEVVVNITVSDTRGGKSAASRSPGSSSTLPEITLNGRNYIKPSELENIEMKADRNGYFQVFVSDAIIPVPSFDENEASYYFNYSTTGGVKNLPVSGILSSTNGKIILPAENGKYYLYVIFRDMLNQTVYTYHEITSDGIIPVPSVNIPDGGYIRKGDSFTFTFAEPVIVQGISGTAQSVDSPPSGEVTMLNIAASGVSGTDKTVSVAYADRSGNQSVTSLAAALYDKDMFVNAGASGNGTKENPCGNIQWAIDNLNLAYGEYGLLHVAAGTYTRTDGLPVVEVNGKNNIFLVGGYTGQDYNQSTRKRSSTLIQTSGTASTSGTPFSVCAFKSSTNCVIDGFTVSIIPGVSSNGDYSAISIDNSNTLVINNETEVLANTGANVNWVYGIYCSNSDPVIMNNTIKGLDRDSTKYGYCSYGIFMSNTSLDRTCKIINNSIYGGGYSSYINRVCGIHFAGDVSSKTSLIIRNNTINAGVTSFAGSNQGLYIRNNADSSVDLYFQNNIIFMQGGEYATGVLLEKVSGATGSFNRTVQNNNIYGFNTTHIQ